MEFNEDLHSEDVEVPEAERLLVESSGRETLEKTLQELPAEFREAIVLGGTKCNAKKPGA